MRPEAPARRRLDPVNIGCNLLIALLLLIPAGVLVALALMLLASVPLLVALFPTALSLGAVALLVLYVRHRRGRRASAPPPNGGKPVDENEDGETEPTAGPDRPDAPD